MYQDSVTLGFLLDVR